MKKLVAGISGLIVALMATAPASAGVFGELETLNPNGGTSASNGIKVDYAAGSIQVTRNSNQQIYPAQVDFDENPDYFCETGVTPDADQQACVSSAFAVTLTSVNYDDTFNIGIPDPYSSLPAGAWGDTLWTTITSESTVDADGSGTIHSVLTYDNFDYCEEGCYADVVLDVVIDYTYPNQYINVTTNLTFEMNPSDVGFYSDDWIARVYYYEDATLSGADEGNQFEGTDANGNVIAGVIRPDGAALEGVRTITDNTVHYYVGNYWCPVDGFTGNCPDVDGGWMAVGDDLPDVVDLAENLDNGFAVQAGPAIDSDTILNVASADNSFDLLFMACEVGTTDPTACIDAGGYSGGLAATGVDGVQTTSLIGALFVATGVAVVARRRLTRRA